MPAQSHPTPLTLWTQGLNPHFLCCRLIITEPAGFPRLLSGKEPACQFRRHRFDPWVGKNPWRRKWQPTPVFFLGKSHGQRNLPGYSLSGRKESDVTDHARTHTLSVWIGFREGQNSQHPRVSWVFIHKDLLVFVIPGSLSMKSKTLDGVRLTLAGLYIKVATDSYEIDLERATENP